MWKMGNGKLLYGDNLFFYCEKMSPTANPRRCHPLRAVKNFLRTRPRQAARIAAGTALAAALAFGGVKHANNLRARDIGKKTRDLATLNVDSPHAWANMGKRPYFIVPAPKWERFGAKFPPGTKKIISKLTREREGIPANKPLTKAQISQTLEVLANNVSQHSPMTMYRLKGMADEINALKEKLAASEDFEARHTQRGQKEAAGSERLRQKALQLQIMELEDTRTAVLNFLKFLDRQPPQYRKEVLKEFPK